MKCMLLEFLICVTDPDPDLDPCFIGGSASGSRTQDLNGQK
jgi:hypothetical protein